MKTCPNCKKQLPDEAHICPVCMTDLSEKTSIDPPRLGKKTALRLAAAAVIVLAAVLLIMTALRRNTIIEGNGEVIVSTGGESWHFVLRHSHNDLIHFTTPEYTYEKTFLPDSMATCPSQLYVFTESGDSTVNLKDRFDEVVENCSIEVTASKGEAAEASTPVYAAGFPDAALVSDVVYTDKSIENDICWVLKLKDGRTLKIHQSMIITTLELVEYSYKDMQLSTAEELNALLDEIKKANDESKAYTIILAPEVYEGDIVLDGITITLQGTKPAHAETEMHGTVFIKTTGIFVPQLNGLVFSGEGTGIVDTAGFLIDSCVFKGLDTGIDVLEGGYAITQGCTFENCKTGLHFQSNNSRTRSPWFLNNTFTNNEFAVLLDMVPGSDVLHFDQCVFSGNGQDIVNNTRHEVLMY